MSKYKILGKHRGGNNKILGSQYVAENFIDKDKVQICYQSNFGKNGCRRKKDGSVPHCRWYSDKTYQFCVDNDLDKLDDLSDTILMQIFEQNKNGDNRSNKRKTNSTRRTRSNRRKN